MGKDRNGFFTCEKKQKFRIQALKGSKITNFYLERIRSENIAFDRLV